MGSHLVNHGPSDAVCAHVTFMGQIVPSVKDNVSPDFHSQVRHNPRMGSWMSEEEFNTLLCERISRLRIEHGWTQQQMATVLAVPHERYKKYETRDERKDNGKKTKQFKNINTGKQGAVWRKEAHSERN